MYKDFALIANQIADEAGPLSLSFFRQPLDIIDKLDASPVTIADRQTEHLIRDRLKRAFPDHGIVGEEFGTENAESDFVWVIDPIDGTRAFILGIPLYGTLIALLHKGKPVVGLIDIPGLQDRWIGCKGQPTTHNGKVCSPNQEIDLSKAYLLCTSPDMFNEEELLVFEHLSSKCKDRRYGTDCLAAGLIASGFGHLMFESALQPYDFAALVPVIEGMGGVATDWQGQSLGLESGPQVLIAANPTLHQKALALVQGPV